MKNFLVPINQKYLNIMSGDEPVNNEMLIMRNKFSKTCKGSINTYFSEV